MGKYSKKTIKNRIRTEDKMRKEAGEVPKNAKTLTNRMINNAKRIDREAELAIKKQSRNISCIANSCILCYTMSVMRDKWKFSAEKLRVLYHKWVDTYDSITYKDGVPVADLLNTVTGADAEYGDVGFKKYQIRVFDIEKDEFDKAPGETKEQKLMNYYARKRLVGYMNTAEVISIIVLFDYFGFTPIKLGHYINYIRNFYDLTFTAVKKMVLQLEEKCQTEFEKFNLLKITKEDGGITVI